MHKTLWIAVVLIVLVALCANVAYASPPATATTSMSAQTAAPDGTATQMDGCTTATRQPTAEAALTAPVARSHPLVAGVEPTPYANAAGIGTAGYGKHVEATARAGCLTGLHVNTGTLTTTDHREYALRAEDNCKTGGTPTAGHLPGHARARTMTSVATGSPSMTHDGTGKIEDTITVASLVLLAW